jgi:glycosyltransferase involved in cell wall biosynthesis
MSKATWHIVTPEYPPQIGGVADYCRRIAEELRVQEETVVVWPPGQSPLTNGFSRSSLRGLHAALDASPAPRRLFVQWVPHGYGYKAMNVAFCWWLLERRRAGDEIDLMVHEAFLPFREGSWKQDAVAAVHRLMISLALRAATRVWVSIPRWTPQLRPWMSGAGKPVEWLPIPSSIQPSLDAPADLHAYFPRQAPVVGHFGTYGTQVTAILRQFVPVFLSRSSANLLLLGRDSAEAARGFANPRVSGTGTLDGSGISRHFQACAAMYQPFSDGISTRRSSAMSLLAHGLPIVSHTGPATEPIWSESGAIVLARPTGQDGAIPEAVDALEELLRQPERRLELGRKAFRCYDDHFRLDRIVRRLRQAGGSHR